MRCVLLLGLVACYRPASFDDCQIACVVGAANDCPSGQSCVDGLCSSSTQCTSPIDAVQADAPPMLPPACTIGTYVFDIRYSAPSVSDYAKYTTNMARTLAVFEQQVTEVMTTYQPRCGPVDTFPLDTPIKPAGDDVFHAGVLAPDGDEVFVQNTRTASHEFAVVGGGGVWDPPRRMRVFASSQEVVLDALDFPGTPMARSAEQRRMMIQKGPELWELVEHGQQPSSPPDRWDVAATYTPQQLGFAFVQHPQLSADGLRLVFRGQLAGQTVAIFGITRTSRAMRFGATPVKLIDSIAPMHPFLSADCEYLYVWSSGMVERHERTRGG